MASDEPKYEQYSAAQKFEAIVTFVEELSSWKTHDEQKE